MRRKFLAKALSKTAVLGVMLSLACSSGVFAYQSSHVSGSAPVNGGFIDQAGIFRPITGEVSCNGTIAWEEGIAGWIVDASFGASASVDGQAVSLDGSYDMKKSGNVAYREFKLSTHGIWIKATLTCDDYGNHSISGSVKK